MARVKDSFQRTVEVTGPVRLEVEAGSGDVTIQRGEEGKLQVHSEFEVWAPSRRAAQELADRIRADPPVEVTGKGVHIGELSKYGLPGELLGPSVSFDFVIAAPPRTEAWVDTGSGDLTVGGISGPVRVDTGSGDVEIHDVEAAVEVDTGSGDAVICRVRSVKVDTGSGEVKLAEIAGRAEVDTGSGDLHARDLQGDLAVDTGSGDIVLESAIADHARWTLDTGSGDAVLYLPPGSSFHLEVETDYGEFATDFPLLLLRKGGGRIVGRVGENPTATIRIQTTSGDVRIKAT